MSAEAGAAHAATLAWANWTLHIALPQILNVLGHPDGANRVTQLKPVHDKKSASDALSSIMSLVEAADGEDHRSPLFPAIPMFGELADAEGDVGWLLSRVRYDAMRCAENAIALGIDGGDMLLVASSAMTEPPVN